MKTILLAVFLVTSGSAWATAVEENTVAANRTITKAVRAQLAPKMAEAILSAPYDGFYQISGRQKRNNEFRFNKVRGKKSFPDARWEQLAVDVTKRIDFRGASNNAGSKRKASATAYVVFYKGGIEGVRNSGLGESLALVMINQQNAINRDMPTVKGLSTSKLYLLDVGLN